MQKDLKLDAQWIYLGFDSLQMIVITYMSKTFSKGAMEHKVFNGFRDGRRVQDNSCM